MNRTIITAAILLLAAGCGEQQASPPATAPETTAPAAETAAPVTAEDRRNTSPLTMPRDTIVAHPEVSGARNAYFGDLHVHTTYSFDAFAFGTLNSPYDAYRYARGEKIKHPAGFDIQLRQPLDFYAVTDHAMFLGASRQAADPTTEFAQQPHVQYMHGLNAPEQLVPGTNANRGKAFSAFLSDSLGAIANGTLDEDLINNIARDAWADTIKAAEQYNEPGKFTTFVAYEYTSSSNDRGNLHRNVFFRTADKLPSMPFSRFHSQDPEGLWDWMDDLREAGIESLAIPHNSNGSNGQMFKLTDWAGDPLDDSYAEKRMRNEPLVEITQIKGTSETHPLLSDNDEWAGFEIMPYRIATMLESQPDGSYARQALLNGLALQDQGTENPFKFGFVGASDTHTAAISDDESNFFGKIGLLDAEPHMKGSVPLPEAEARVALEQNQPTAKSIGDSVYRTAAQITWAASGLAGVWAEDNTREDIYNAFRRKETFATSGPRIKVRLFAGYNFNDATLNAPDAFVQGYAEGVPMGSDLLAEGDRAPVLMAWAMRDTRSAPLQRLQIVKGWTVDGEPFEEVYDVACADGLKVDPATNRCPDNGAKVSLEDCSISADVGDAELKAAWRDPDFNPAHRAFYYVRALENPTCRWSTWDAIRAGVAPRPDFPATIQERAWTSPIWFVPE